MAQLSLINCHPIECVQIIPRPLLASALPRRDNPALLLVSDQSLPPLRECGPRLPVARRHGIDDELRQGERGGATGCSLNRTLRRRDTYSGTLPTRMRQAAASMNHSALRRAFLKS